jgi:hypothetical protein
MTDEITLEQDVDEVLGLAETAEAGLDGLDEAQASSATPEDEDEDEDGGSSEEDGGGEDESE